MKFNVTFKKGPAVVAQAKGIRMLRSTDVPVEDFEKVLEIEKFLERITGLRVHIEQA